MIETFNRYETLITILSLAAFVGGPTTLAAGLAIRLAIRGGVTIARRVAVSVSVGAVATAAAYYYIQGSDGGGGGVALALPVAGVTANDLRRESITLHFRTDSNGVPMFFRDGADQPLDRMDVVRELSVLCQWGNLRTVDLVDEWGQGGELVSAVESVARNFNLQFNYERRE